MKHALTFLLAFPFLANSQTSGYLPLEVSNAWYFSDASTPAIQVIGDTLIGGRSYKKVCTHAFFVPYPENLCLRVDSSRVFQYYPYTGKDILLYDFSAAAGDTLYSDSIGGFRDCYENELVQYAGRTLRRWGFAYGSSCVDCVNGESLVDSLGWSEFWSPNNTSRLSKVVIAGKTIITGIAKLRKTVPQRFDASVYPNPFNSSAILRYTVPRPGNLRIALFNPLGQQVTALFDHAANRGEATLVIDGDNLSSGVYYCRLVFEDLVQVRKIVLLK